MKPAFLSILLCWLLFQPLYGQFSDDFSDGNINGWQGDTEHFIVNPGEQLQLNAPSGSTSSWLYTPLTYMDSMVWELYVKLQFAPSTTNQLRIYLGATTSDLTIASGYFLEIGASGDQDALELKYLNAGSSSSVASSPPGLVASEPVDLKLRITRKSDGLWECYTLGGVIPELLFTTVHDLLPLTDLGFFGFHCRYTDTRRDKFFFDDIDIQPVVPDTQAPVWSTVAVLDAHSVLLTFDEPLDANEVLNLSHYSLTPGNSVPEEAESLLHEVILHWDQPFISGQEYTLHVQGLRDIAGNPMLPEQKVFTYIHIGKALPFELLITEIMADPTPVVALPDAEYLEIYNATDQVFRLSDYKIRIGTSERNLPDELIYENEYIIMCSEANVALFSGFGRTIGISSLPALTNSGTTVSLRDQDNMVLHEIAYTLAWYGDPGKSDGGWAMEMINPNHICSAQHNWYAANNLIGGTPGSVNSQWSTTPDTIGPGFISLFVAAPDRLVLRFDESLDAILMENQAAYSILPAVSIFDVTLTDPTTLELLLSEELQPGVVYHFLPFDAYDCLLNKSYIPVTLAFGLVAEAVEGDILIHEILFNPSTGGSRFIEIINTSDKFINLSSLSIARIAGGQQNIFPTGIHEIIGPGQLAVFTPSPADILFRYQVPQPNRLYEASLPTWSDQGDHVAILASGVFIDSFTYRAAWHHPVIADQNGVSLERVSVDAPTSSPSSWHSASALSGYGTPTGPNSQQIQPSGEEEMPFTITNKQFSPNGDGYKDFLALNFLLDSGDQIGSVWIYDLEGREVIELVSNASLGTNALVQWDGRSEDGVLADMGIYIIFVQLWDTRGQVREYQKTCALVKR